MERGDPKMSELVDKLSNEDIYVDTSAWFSLIYKRDKYHQETSNLYKKLLENNNRFLTTNLVIGETYTLIRYRIKENSSLAYEFLDIIEDSLRINKIFVNQGIEKNAYKILRQYKENKFSYVDATSFALMKKNNLKYALTLDEHFSVAGFVKL